MQVYRGELETDRNKFNGKVRLKRFPDLVGVEARVLALHFEQGTWTNWHVHAGRQVMYGILGTGCVVSKGGEAVVVAPGDVVYLEPGVTHWHGAAPDRGDFVHTVIAFDRKTFWEFRREDGAMAPQAVSVEDYRAIWAGIGDSESGQAPPRGL